MNISKCLCHVDWVHDVPSSVQNIRYPNPGLRRLGPLEARASGRGGTLPSPWHRPTLSSPRASNLGGGDRRLRAAFSTIGVILRMASHTLGYALTDPDDDLSSSNMLRLLILH